MEISGCDCLVQALFHNGLIKGQVSVASMADQIKFDLHPVLNERFHAVNIFNECKRIYLDVNCSAQGELYLNKIFGSASICETLEHTLRGTSAEPAWLDALAQVFGDYFAAYNAKRDSATTVSNFLTCPASLDYTAGSQFIFQSVGVGLLLVLRFVPRNVLRWDRLRSRLRSR